MGQTQYLRWVSQRIGGWSPKPAETRFDSWHPCEAPPLFWRTCMHIINSIVEKRFVRQAEPHSLPAPPVRLGWAADAPGHRLVAVTRGAATLPRRTGAPVMGMTAKGAGTPCKRRRSRFDSDLLHGRSACWLGAGLGIGMWCKGEHVWFGARLTGFESLLPDWRAARGPRVRWLSSSVGKSIRVKTGVGWFDSSGSHQAPGPARPGALGLQALWRCASPPSW